MKNTAYIISLTIFMAGCGNQIRNIEECIPKASFISTKVFKFISYRITDESSGKAYDPLSISKSQEWYLYIADVDNPTIDFNIPIEKEDHAKGAMLNLSGEAKIHAPYGLMSIFRSPTTYLKGNIDDKTVWVHVLGLKNFNSAQEKSNKESMRITGLNKFIDEFSCLKS